MLHIWTQDLRRHLHVHALMACGALKSRSGSAADSAAEGCATSTPSWVTPTRGERFLFPVHALSRVFWGKFIAALQAAQRAGDLPRDPADAPARLARTQALRGHAWVVYAKTPFAGLAAVLDYLSR